MLTAPAPSSAPARARRRSHGSCCTGFTNTFQVQSAWLQGPHRDRPLAMDPLPISRIILYVRDIPKVAAFYQQHFGLKPLPGADDGWLELAAANGLHIALHQAAKSQKRGSEIKIVFAV